MGNENCLVGRVINKIQIAKDKKAIRFLTNEGEVIARSDGDCCSYSWIEHIEMVELPAKVLNAEDIEMPDLGDLPGCECVAYYGFRLTTDKGHVIIDYRNDSNGYYGGSLCWPGDQFYGGVNSQNVSGEEWVDPSEVSSGYVEDE